jgi:hypothetical protein
MVGTPVCALQNECGELPLALRRKKQMLQYNAKIKATVNHPARGIIRAHKQEHVYEANVGIESFSSKVADFDVCHNITMEKHRVNPKPPWLEKLPQIDLSLRGSVKKSDSVTSKREIVEKLMEKYEGQLHIYTDGSKAPDAGTVSAAFVIPALNVQRACRITNDVSVYTAELIALQMALQMDCRI